MMRCCAHACRVIKRDQMTSKMKMIVVQVTFAFAICALTVGMTMVMAFLNGIFESLHFVRAKHLMALLRLRIIRGSYNEMLCTNGGIIQFLVRHSMLMRIASVSFPSTGWESPLTKFEPLSIILNSKQSSRHFHHSNSHAFSS